MTEPQLSRELTESLLSMGAAGTNGRFFDTRNRCMNIEYGSESYRNFLSRVKLYGLFSGQLLQVDGPLKDSECWLASPTNRAMHIRRAMADRLLFMKPGRLYFEAREYDEEVSELESRTWWTRSWCGSLDCIRPSHLVVTRGPIRLPDPSRLAPSAPVELPDGMSAEDLDQVDFASLIRTYHIQDPDALLFRPRYLDSGL